MERVKDFSFFSCLLRINICHSPYTHVFGPCMCHGLTDVKLHSHLFDPGVKARYTASTGTQSLVLYPITGSCSIKSNKLIGIAFDGTTLMRSASTDGNRVRDEAGQGQCS
eukprot:sb/3477315/